MPVLHTPEQQEIIAHDLTRHARILAGPGTGKSASLVALVNRLRTKDPGCRIRLLTFTRAATSELAKKVSEHPAAAAERPSTIHSFAISVLLRNRGAGSPPQPLRIADDWEYQHTVLGTLSRRMGIGIPRLKRLFREMAANWESLRPEEDPKVDPRHRALFLGGWNEHRQIFGYTLLSELPYALRAALRDHPDLQGADYDLLVVDEYQDLNACDLEALRLLAERGCWIVAAGDDDQSIYSFRKAAPEGIRRFPLDYPGCADYSLSVTQRCGSRIVDWASYVIEGDPDRPRGKPRVRSVEGSPEGEVALLSFASERSEAEGVALLVRNLIQSEGIRTSEILVLMRTDDRGRFSGPVRTQLARLGIAYSDPDVVQRMLEEPGNRQLLEALRLLVHRQDSLAWAGLLTLTARIGTTFVDFVYEQARQRRCSFGQALLDLYGNGFPEGPSASSQRARDLVTSALAWLDAHPVPETAEGGWGRWIIETSGGGLAPPPSDPLRELLLALDGLVEPDQGLGRFIGQIGPLGKDLTLALSEGVRIMRLGGAKGLTVKATIIVGLEDGLIPRPDCDLGEERRLLYVGMTRAEKFLFGTWARRRRGPTARAGSPAIHTLRRHSTFLDNGPVNSEDGMAFVRRRWPAAI